MYLPDFSYYQPENLREACRILADSGGKAKVLAGGTDLLPKMKQALLSPEVLVSLRNIQGISDIKHSSKGVTIGARATPNDLVNSPVLHKHYLSVSEAAHSMANNQVRNMGTAGGNIVNAVPSADLPPILISLGATVKLVGSAGERVVPLEEFFTGPNRSVIAPDEILTEISIPDRSATGSHYIKFGLRRSGSLAVVGVAVAVSVAGDEITEARIALGAVSPVPMRAGGAEALLRGKKISDDLLEEAGVAAAAECKPITDMRGSVEYRRDLVRVLTRRALRRAVDEGHV